MIYSSSVTLHLARVAVPIRQLLLGKHQKGVTLGVLAPEGGHFDFKPQKGVTLLISHTGVTVFTYQKAPGSISEAGRPGTECVTAVGRLRTLCQASPASLIDPGGFW